MKSAERMLLDELQYESKFNALLEQSVFGVDQVTKERSLLALLNLLHQHHLLDCQAYSNIFGAFAPANNLDDIPYLAVRLFKLLSLQSVPESDVFKILYSSGTTSQTPAKVVLDRDTSARQSRVLVKILQEFIGKRRLPMLIIDSASILKDRQSYSARGAGIQGISIFGRDHTYALDADMKPDWQAIEGFCAKYPEQPVLIFGFTFMVWQYFIQTALAQNKKLNLSQGVLLHSGGWKKLESEKVGNDEFKQAVQDIAGISKVHNFYGMAEQVGSIFVECEQGHLHAPIFADVIVRDPYHLKPVKTGEQGLIQVLSALPTSYPGQSILTEDMGRISGIDDCACGRKGKYFQVSGRLPKTETRGCSDTHRTV